MALYIVRENNDELALYRGKPTRKHDAKEYEDSFEGEFVSYMAEDLFPEVTSENSPRKIEIILKD